MSARRAEAHPVVEAAATEARTAADEAAALLEPLPDDAVAAQLETLLLLGWSETTIERPGTACAHLRRALALADRTRQAHLLPDVRYGLAAALTWSGELTEAACAGAEAIEGARSTGSVHTHLWALRTRCTTAILAGDLAAATRLGEEACGLAGTTAGIVATLAGATLAEMRLTAGESTRPGTRPCRPWGRPGPTPYRQGRSVLLVRTAGRGRDPVRPTR